MISSKIWASAVLWLLLALPFAQSQTTALVPVTPKWEFGLRGGAGFSSIHLDNRNPRRQYFLIGGENGLHYEHSSPRPELYIGAYATRHFGQHWSVRSELSVASKNFEGMAVSLGVFPRYRLTSWLNLEAGLETRLPLSIWGKSETRYSLGAAFGGKDLEFNLRFAPAYQPSTPFGRASWLGSIQAGASFKLASVGKVFRGKKG